MRIPPDWEPEVASDLPSRRGVRFGGGFGEIARVLTLLLFEDKMAPPRGDYEEQGEYLSRNAMVILMIREECFMPTGRRILVCRVTLRRSPSGERHRGVRRRAAAVGDGKHAPGGWFWFFCFRIAVHHPLGIEDRLLVMERLT